MAERKANYFMKNLLKIKNQIYVSIGYTLIMGLGWWINPHPYGEIDNVIFMIPTLGLLAMLAVYLIKRVKIKFTNNKLQKSKVLWLFIGMLIYLLLNNVLVVLDGGIIGPWQKLALLLVATMLVGVAEEGVFRGYILNKINQKLGVKKALFYSSILFGLLHSVNFLAGPSIAQTIAQVVLTAAMGYVFGVIYLKTNRDLLLVMVLHGIYDFLVFSFTYLKNLNNSPRTTILVAPIMLILWVYSLLLVRKNLGIKS